MTLDDPPGAGRPRRYGPRPLGLLPVVVLLLGGLPLATSDARLAWVPLVPVAAAVWVLRARVVARDDGLLVCNGLAAHLHPWPCVEGFDVPRLGPVRLVLPGRRVPLTALSRNDLQALLAAAPPGAG